jgi:replicative DNA helicase
MLSPETLTLRTSQSAPPERANFAQPDLERAVLGAALLERGAPAIMLRRLPNAEAFALRAHQFVFEAIRRLHFANKPVDLLTVFEELKSTNQLEATGGSYYLAELAGGVLSAANLDYYCVLLLEYALRRKGAQLARDLLLRLNDPSEDVFEVYEAASGLLKNALEGTLPDSARKLSDLLPEVLNTLEEVHRCAQTGTGQLKGASWGYPWLDGLTGGLVSKRLYVLAARSGKGKTTFAENVARHVARSGKGVLFFSLEMEATDLITKSLASESGVLSSRMELGQMSGTDWQATLAAANRLEPLPIFYDDGFGLTLQGIQASVARLASQVPLGLVVVDYLQLVRTPERRPLREQEVAEVSRALKVLSVAHNVPVLALAQLNKEVDKREGQKPTLADLRESSAIENDADVVGLLWYPDALHETTALPHQPVELGLILAKNRRGARGELSFTFHRDTGKIVP